MAVVCARVLQQKYPEADKSQARFTRNRHHATIGQWENKETKTNFIGCYVSLSKTAMTNRDELGGLVV